MIKALIILTLILPFVYLGFKSFDVAVDKKKRGSKYIVKEYPVVLLGIIFFGVAGVIVANVKSLMAFL